MIYRIIELTDNKSWLGNEQAVIDFANENLKVYSKEYIQEYRKDFENIGFIFKNDTIEEIKNIELAIKFLQRIANFEVVDLGDVISILNDGYLVSLSEEE